MNTIKCTINVLSNEMYNICMVDDNSIIKYHRFISEVDTQANLETTLFTLSIY